MGGVDTLPAGSAEIVCGDAHALDLPDNSVDLIVTSPPYFGLRDYGTPGQVGAERTTAEYIAELVACTREMTRVLKSSGSIFVNLGDRYGPDKSLLLLPERYRIAVRDELSLTARGVVVWSKVNPVPDTPRDRVRRTHEDWVHLTRSSRYYADMDPLRIPSADSNASRKRALDATGGVSAARDALVYPGRPGEVRHSGVPGVGTTFIGRRRDKTPGSVWSLPTEPLRGVPAGMGQHTAPFPVEWPRRLILGWCPPGGVVLDPFGGTGTTALVALTLGRRGISIDLNETYCEIARWRCADPAQQARAARVA